MAHLVKLRIFPLLIPIGAAQHGTAWHAIYHHSGDWMYTTLPQTCVPCNPVLSYSTPFNSTLYYREFLRACLLGIVPFLPLHINNLIGRTSSDLTSIMFMSWPQSIYSHAMQPREGESVGYGCRDPCHPCRTYVRRKQEADAEAECAAEA